MTIFLTPCSFAATYDPEVKYQEALQLANEGQHDTALIILSELSNTYSETLRYLYDYITVLSWAEQYAGALALIPRIDTQEAPIYVLESLGNASRGIGDLPQAVQFYRMVLTRDPERSKSVIGLAYSLTDLGKPNEAVELLQSLLQQQPENSSALESMAYAHLRNNHLYEAISIYDRLLTINPDHREANRQRILITSRLGAAPRALEMAHNHPGLLSDEELDSLTIDAASKYLRWSGLYHPLPAERFEDTDQAIAMLQELLTRLEASGEGNSFLAQRVRFDLIVALHSRNRSQQALALYESLQDEGVEIPDYVSQAAADAYLATQQPERAYEIYSNLLQDNPENFQLRMDLFYTLMDLSQQERAYDVIDKLAVEQTDPDLRLRTESSAAMARAWSGELQEAQSRYEKLTQAAPNNPHLRAEQGYVYLWRGWPRRALDEFRIAQAIEPEILSAHLGEINAYRDRNAFDVADTNIKELLASYPNDPQVDKLRRSWDIHNMRELWVQASAARSNDSQFSSRDLELDTHLYSRPISIDYRIFLHDYLAQSTFPEGEATYHRLGAGLEYRARDLELSGEVSDGFGRDAGLGLSLHGLWMVDDHWRVNGGYDSYSNELPLRGRLAEDIDGWSLSAGAEYRVHESRSFAAGIQRLEFSDNNQRTIANAAVFQRLINRPRYKLDGRLGLYTSRNTRDNAPYFNPSSDLSLDASVTNEWLITPGNTRGFLQRLGISLGLYQESGYGINPVGGMNYEHEWRLYERLNLIYGLALNRPVYSDIYETHTRLYANLHWRF